MNLEQDFAAAVINAAGFAKIANTAGIEQRTCDQVACALIELWESGREAGLSPAQIREIAALHVEYDVDGEPWPRSFSPNVVAFRR